jgi:hypothetical protein
VQLGSWAQVRTREKAGPEIKTAEAANIKIVFVDSLLGCLFH